MDKEETDARIEQLCLLTDACQKIAKMREDMANIDWDYFPEESNPLDLLRATDKTLTYALGIVLARFHLEEERIKGKKKRGK